MKAIKQKKEKGLEDLAFYYDAHKNVITNRHNRVIKWCDARHGKFYMFFQRIKCKIFGR